MRLSLFAPASVLLVACGGGGDNPAGKTLQNAAEQSDPAAAAVLNEAAETGMNEQQALEIAGQAQVRNAQETPAGPPEPGGEER